MKTVADLPSSFWGGWIVVLTVTSLAGLVWLLFSVYFSKSEHDQQHVTWDETLTEGSHPAPMWWFWFILALMVISAAYLMLYPGLGTYAGTLKWSQSGRLDDSYSLYNERYDAIRKGIMATPIQTLQEDEYLMQSTRGIFDRNCAVCHGPEAQGQASMFPDLTDGVWQWGGNIAQIEQSIRSGRRAIMPGWAASLDDQGINQVIAYIRTLGQQTIGTNYAAGEGIYRQYCAGCHGIDGAGNIALGAPNLTDRIWLYGDSDESLIETIANGRVGVMPAFEGRLDDVQIRMLIALLAKRVN
jgi:cytochrome c oxidase cbb3-type subunit 3